MSSSKETGALTKIGAAGISFTNDWFGKTHLFGVPVRNQHSMAMLRTMMRILVKSSFGIEGGNIYYGENEQKKDNLRRIILAMMVFTTLILIPRMHNSYLITPGNTFRFSA